MEAPPGETTPLFLDSEAPTSYSHPRTGDTAVVVSTVGRDGHPTVIMTIKTADERIIAAGVKFKIINGVVHWVLGGGLFLAMIPQGAEAWIEASFQGGFTETMAPGIGLGSHLGKFCLLLFYAMNRFGEENPSVYEAVALALAESPEAIPQWFKDICHGRWSKEGVAKNSIFIASVIMGILGPGESFGLLTYTALDAFIKTVRQKNAGSFFQALADVAGVEGFRDACAVGSFIGNVITTPVVLRVTYYNAMGLKKKYRELKENPDTTKADYLQFFLSMLGGTATTGVTGTGFWNFFGLTRDSIKTYAPDWLQWTKYVSPTVQYSYMLALGFINAFPLGEGAVNIVFDVCRGQFDWPRNEDDHSINGWKIAGTLTQASFTALIVLLGAFPNLWQAADQQEKALFMWSAFFASMETETIGTYSMLGKAVNLIGRAASKITSCCPSVNFCSFWRSGTTQPKGFTGHRLNDSDSSEHDEDDVNRPDRP